VEAGQFCNPKDLEETHILAEMLLDSVLAQAPADAAHAVEVLRLGGLRCSDNLGVVQAMAQEAGALRSGFGRQLAIAGWQHLQGLRPDSHLNPAYQARVVYLVAHASPIDVEELSKQVGLFEKRYGPGSGWVEALAADEALQVVHRATRREVLQTAASAAHARARETRELEDWDQVLSWTLRLGGDGSDPEATRAWALAAWESGDKLKAESVLREQAENQPQEALSAMAMLAALHWNAQVVTRGSLAAPPIAEAPEQVMVLEGGHLRPRYPLAVQDRALLRAADDYLAILPPVDTVPSPPSIALAAAVLTLGHGQLPETQARLVGLIQTWPESAEAETAICTLSQIGTTYAQASRQDRPPELCRDHAVAVAWAKGPGANAGPDAHDALAAWRTPRCRGALKD
jgi:hypothetical protein